MTSGLPYGIESAAAPRARLLQLCAAGACAYCSYAMCRSPLLPLFARELGADARLIGGVVAASTLTGVLLKLPAAHGRTCWAGVRCSSRAQSFLR
jgi:hypothetical protein